MNESEFRDWLRGQLAGMNERMTRLERREREPAPPPPVPESIRLEAEELLGELLKLAQAGRIEELGVAFFRDGRPMTAIAGQDRVRLLGVVELLKFELLKAAPAPETAEAEQ